MPIRSRHRSGKSRKRRFLLFISAAILVPATWIITSALTARPSPDPTIPAQAVALALARQPDPTAPSRYEDLEQAILELLVALDSLAEPLDGDPKYPPSTHLIFLDRDWLNADNSHDIAPEKVAAYIEGIRRAAYEIDRQNLFAEFFDLLQSPNLARDYSEVFQADQYVPKSPRQVGSDSISRLRQCALAVSACARIYALDGHSEKAAQFIQPATFIPAMLNRQIFLIHTMNAASIADRLASDISFIAVQPNLTQDALVSLRSSQRMLLSSISLEVAFDGLELMQREVHFFTHTRSGRFLPATSEHHWLLETEWMRAIQEDREEGPVPEPGVFARLRNIRGFLTVDRDTSLTTAMDQYAQLRLAWQEPDADIRGQMRASIRESFDSLGSRYPLLQGTHGETITKLVESCVYFKARLTALGILLHMAEYRLDHGDWPESLNQLIPDYLDAIPTDPRTGKPFEYRHEPGQPPSLDRFEPEPAFGS
jgi:hypothetical protein